MIFGSVCPGRLNTRDLITVTRHISYSDWIFLYYLAKNLEPFVFQDFLSELACEFRRDYIDENATLNVTPEPKNQINERDTIQAESIDEVDMRRK